MIPAIPGSSAAKPRRAKSEFKSGLQAGTTPSTKIRRRSSAVRLTFRASAYSGEAYHSRRRAIDGNSTTTMFFGSAAADQIAAAIVCHRFGRERAVGLDPHGIKHLEFGNHIGRHRILLRMFDKRRPR